MTAVMHLSMFVISALEMHIMMVMMTADGICTITTNWPLAEICVLREQFYYFIL